MALAPRAITRERRIFRRGDWKRLGDAVTPDTPAVLPPFPNDAPRNRLGLAQWIAAKNNPLTARVIVNRVCSSISARVGHDAGRFRRALRTAIAPALLDWLAGRIYGSGWSIKHLHRLVVNSAVYRQSSKLTPKLQEADPTNRWLARAPRFAR